MAEQQPIPQQVIPLQQQPNLNPIADSYNQINLMETLLRQVPQLSGSIGIQRLTIS